MEQQTKKQPKIGDTIYISSSYCDYHGEYDFEVGLATISKIEYNNHLPKDHLNYTMIRIKERTNTMYNWKLLLEKQDELKKEYGNQIV